MGDSPPPDYAATSPGGLGGLARDLARQMVEALTRPDPEPDFIVLRPGPDLPPGVMSPDLDGAWIDRAHLRGGTVLAAGQGRRFVPVDRFEARDGAVAQVWELHG